MDDDDRKTVMISRGEYRMLQQYKCQIGYRDVEGKHPMREIKPPETELDPPDEQDG